ncbi:MAG TPA: protein phosphatase 2C domain-containing protein [Pyrinomonadaceae bacterium]
MNTDKGLDIGSTHSLCQDYVIARNLSTNNSRHYVFLSDGCSSSSDTDIGARLLVRAAEKIFNEQEIDDVKQLHNEAARLALEWVALIGIAPESVDATLMSVHVTGGRLLVACSGDGVIVLESQTGTVDLFSISSPSGYPYYPSYAWQPERLSELVANGRTTKEIKHFRRDSVNKPFALLDLTTSDSPTEVLNLHASDYKYAAVASDGIDSFFHTQQSANGKRVEDVSLLEVLAEFWQFKNSHGAFVERRLKRFTKDARANGWQHADDLSLGMIYLE